MAAGRRHPPPGGDTGAALVEAAVALTVVMVLLSGVVAVSSASSAAAGLERVVSAAVRDTTVVGAAGSDVAALARIAAHVGDLRSLDVERVVVFNATAHGAAVPAECMALPVDGGHPAGVAGVCNVFGPAHLDVLRSGAAPEPGCGAQSWERWWCPPQRRRTRPNPDRVGVHVVVAHDPGALLVRVPGADRISATAVATVDPDDGHVG